MTDAPLPADIASTPVGEAVRFVMEQLRCNGAAPLEAFTARFLPEIAAATKNGIPIFTAEIGPYAVVAYRLPKPDICVAELQGDDGRGWALGIALADGKIRLGTFPRPPGLSYRPVTPADADALAALEKSAPIVTGDVETVYDRSRDYFEAERLMGGEAFVVEREGVIVGLHACVVHPVRIAGRDLQGIYDHRTRVDPTARRGGVSGLAALPRFEAVANRSGRVAPYSFIAADNDAVLGRRWQGPHWQEPAERLVLDTGSAAATGVGRPATAADAERLVALLNDTHGEEELFCPYSPDSLRERLSRAPDSYSWSSVLISERACVGVWSPKIGVTRREGGVETRDIRAFVLDYGCTPDGVGELVALVDDWRARLAADGTTELSIFTSAGSRGAAALTALAKRREPYVVGCPLPPGDGVKERGIYVDQLYF
jgi:L-amino acid N-acyltransferase YncA